MGADVADQPQHTMRAQLCAFAYVLDVYMCMSAKNSDWQSELLNV